MGLGQNSEVRRVGLKKEGLQTIINKNNLISQKIPPVTGHHYFLLKWCVYVCQKSKSMSLNKNIFTIVQHRG